MIATVQVPPALRAAPWEGSVLADPTSSVASAADAKPATMDSRFASVSMCLHSFSSWPGHLLNPLNLLQVYCSLTFLCRA